MFQGTFSDTLIRPEAFKRVFLFRPKMDFFPWFWPKMTKVCSRHFSLVYLPRDLGVS